MVPPVCAFPELEAFHPAVATWFSRRFPDGPSEAQREGWPTIRSGSDTLVAAPTGSGKTLAGFLVAIDRLYRAHAAGREIAGAVRVVYVSPLKALAVDIHENLERPLAEIAEVARELGAEVAPVTVAVRTGDTAASARAAMISRPPTLLVTTPESLYLLLTAKRSRETLRGVECVIVDEIHALARDKRGSHLSLSLERLDRLQVGHRPQRVGLSATQRPIERTAALLGGSAQDGEARPVSVVDRGHVRELDLAVELPGSELGAVASTEQLGEILDAIAAHVAEHRTTLVFVNTRRLSERLAHELGERLGADAVAAHHGSLSKERRLRVERRLRAGELRALVATASLELGIDIGPVELVCQVGSPRSIATFLQRVGRSNHSRGGVPAGRLFPMTRDELVESAALLAAVRGGRLDTTELPVAPLDILIQQVVAEVAAMEEVSEDDLFATVRGATPYRGLERAVFDEALALASDGIPTGRGRRMAYLHRDRVHGVLRPRRGARLAALMNGGAIPEVGDYRVVLDPDEVTLGAVNEDFAIESMVGDVFLLGTHPWRIRRVEAGVVRVVDAAGANPTIPFWVGESFGRSAELSEEVSVVRREVARLLGGDGAPGADPEVLAAAWVGEHCGVDPEVADQVVAYLAAGLAQLGTLPSSTEVVFERFFDEAGGMQLVVHAPFGSRVTKAYGLALRKRFCATFDFELQAAANDDALVLSLGPQHSFPLEQAPRLLHADGAAATLSQAVLASPMFVSRWRWNLNRSLAVLRMRAGRKNPLPIQRMEADDLMAAVFPALAACQENAPAGPIQIPDHLLVRQTVADCLHEAMDVDGLLSLLRAMDGREVATRFVDSTEPSVLAHEILNGRPYTFLDDAPLEERRTRAVALRRGVPFEPVALGALDPAAIERVRGEAAPELRSAEELHDLLLQTVVLDPACLGSPGADPASLAGWFDQLADGGRAFVVAGLVPGVPRWAATERLAWVEALFPELSPPALPLAAEATGPLDADEAAAEAVRGHLEIAGPVTVGQLCAATGLAPTRIAVGLGRLEAEGFAIAGRFDPASGEEDGQWCSRRLLARIHGYTRARRRAEIEPVSAQDYLRFLLDWQHVSAGTRRHGRAGVLAVVDQLQGFELAAGAWEESVLPARVDRYDGRWLEDLCMGGQVAWGRLGLRPGAGDEEGRGASVPSRATPITFALREELDWLMRAARGDAGPSLPPHGAARDLYEALCRHGALFHGELAARTGRLPAEVEEGLWDLVARGLVTADGFQAVRSLLSARELWRRRHRQQSRSRLGARRVPTVRAGGEGRWALLRSHAAPDDPTSAADGAPEDLEHDTHELAEAVAEQLLRRWGVVFFDVATREQLAVPWRLVLQALRRFEARGLARGGRFVSGFTGEQYALPEAVDHLQRVRRAPRTGEVVELSAADPLNLVGIVVPGDRVPALRTNRVRYLDGLPLDARTALETNGAAAAVPSGAQRTG